MKVLNRLASLAILLQAPVSYVLTGASPLTYTLLGITIGVYGTALVVTISLIRKVRSMKKLMDTAALQIQEC